MLMPCESPNYFPPYGDAFGAVVEISPHKGDFAEIMNAAIAAVVNGPGGAVVVPFREEPYLAYAPVAYRFFGTCSSLRIVGNGATIRAAVPMEALFRLDGTASTSLLSIEDLDFDANGQALYGFIATSLNQRTSVVGGITTRRARQSGLWIRGCQAAVFRDCRSHENGLDGFRIEGAFATRLTGCSAFDNGRDGFRLASLGSLPSDTTQFGPEKKLVFGGTHGPELVGCGSHRNGRDGVNIAPPPSDTISFAAAATNAFTLQNCSITGNGRHGVRIAEDVRAVLLDTVDIVPGPHTRASASAIRLRSRVVPGASEPVCPDVKFTIADGSDQTRPSPRLTLRKCTTRPRRSLWTSVPAGSCVRGTLEVVS